MKNLAESQLDAIFRSALADQAAMLAPFAADEEVMLGRVTRGLARRRTRRVVALLLAAALVIGLTGAIAVAGRDPDPMANATLRRSAHEISFSFDTPDGMTLEIYDDWNHPREGIGPSGWIAFTQGGPSPYGYARYAPYGYSSDRSPRQFVEGTRGIVVADVTDAFVGHGEADPDLRDDPEGFLADLDAKSVFAVSGIGETQLGGVAAYDGTVVRERADYAHLELAGGQFGDGHSVDLTHPSYVVVAKVGDALVLVQVWAGTPEALQDWLPTAIRFVNSIRFRS